MYEPDVKFRNPLKYGALLARNGRSSAEGTVSSEWDDRAKGEALRHCTPPLVIPQGRRRKGSPSRVRVPCPRRTSPPLVILPELEPVGPETVIPKAVVMPLNLPPQFPLTPLVPKHTPRMPHCLGINGQMPVPPKQLHDVRCCVRPDPRQLKQLLVHLGIRPRGILKPSDLIASARKQLRQFHHPIITIPNTAARTQCAGPSPGKLRSPRKSRIDHRTQPLVHPDGARPRHIATRYRLNDILKKRRAAK